MHVTCVMGATCTPMLAFPAPGIDEYLNQVYPSIYGYDVCSYSDALTSILVLIATQHMTYVPAWKHAWELAVRVPIQKLKVSSVHVEQVCRRNT